MIHLAIIEDNDIYKEALSNYLQKKEEVKLVFLDNNLDNFSGLISAAPDVVIMDIDLGKESGIKGVSRIKETLPATQVFMLTVFDDEEKIFESLKAGAIGYMLKKDPPKKILEAIRSVYKGEGVINGQIARKISEYFQKPVKSKPDWGNYNLSNREKEILSLLMDGLTYREIAASCFISLDTINSHIRNIYTKLNVRSRAEIAAKFR